ncbi:NO-inducible flavohemoprotein [Bacillus paranthracis]|uniref:NO-inducible flavohemoprotein n=1 Tax=Bacillus paranthracis TaxID=2026186 RepID=UPI002150F08B|nr:NO-inducible flavohemoprotein [Bacillus paranthracis]MCR6466152.1 NO-inducible flavohemoprotein [Bacillus paranthracis]MCR9020003.1 NO-inducible flavohemoprotein [Bacillus paranthracis]
MIDEKTIQIVQSTAPVLKEHSTEIGKRFYELLFEKAPDLNNIFNQTNQKRGLQQEALGYAVYAAGEYITNLDAIKPVIERISQKHRAIGIKAEQYPVVGETLLQAVKDVLGDAATDEIIDAWGKAYGYIANAFIEIEKNLYKEAKSKPGGWDGYRNFIVDKKEKESNEVTSFYLTPEDGKVIAAYKPGQYLTIKAKIPGEKYTHIRHYSLSEAPGKDYYHISVKRENEQEGSPDGIVSNYLHKQIQMGDSLSISAPAGDFILKEDDLPVVLISGGIGITPLLNMLEYLTQKESKQSITFIHSTLNSKTHAFHEEIKQLATENENIKSLICYDSPTGEDKASNNFDKEGYINLSFLKSNIATKEANFYICGSLTFMEAIIKILHEWKVPKELIHYESFSPVAILGE